MARFNQHDRGEIGWENSPFQSAVLTSLPITRDPSFTKNIQGILLLFKFPARSQRPMVAENLDQSIGTAQPKTLLKAGDTIAFAEPGPIIDPDNS